MPRNGSGNYTLPSGNPVVTGTLIESSWANNTLGDLASAMTDSLARNGEGGMTAALRVVDGTVSAPGLAFVNETGSGMYRTGAGDYSFSVLGTQKMRVRAGGVDVTADSFNVTSSTAYYPQTTNRNKANDANASYFLLDKDRAGAVVQNNDILGTVAFRGYDGTAYLQGAAMYASIEATPGANDMPTGLAFATTADGGAGPTERLRITAEGNVKMLGTGSLKLPVGTTAQRPAAPAFGDVRANSTTGNPEWWDPSSSQWQQFSQPAGYSVNYLVVAGGGGGGGYNNGGGGGAGGLLTSSVTLTSGTAYTITVGAGGAGGALNSGNAPSGSNSSISGISITAIGGGGAGGYDGGSGGTNGTSGGSGGGGGAGSTTSGGSATSGQGFAGGGAVTNGAGGGGGANAAGSAGSGTTGGAGGAGVANSISGASVTYAGGGGGSGQGTGGAGGAGGGGAGATSGAGTAGTANTGGGGGGKSTTTSTPGGAGGSGIVIIAYAGAQRGTGGTVTSSGGYTIHTFTSSGTYNA